MCLFRNIKQYLKKCCGEGIRMNKMSGDTVNLKKKQKQILYQKFHGLILKIKMAYQTTRKLNLNTHFIKTLKFIHSFDTIISRGRGTMPLINYDFILK